MIIDKIIKTINKTKYRKLSKCHIKNRFAICENCGEIFIDDILLYNSIFCPNKTCKGWSLYREDSLSEAKRRQQEFKRYKKEMNNEY